MESILEQIEEWFKGLLVSGIMSNIGRTFEYLNEEVSGIAADIGASPQSFSPAIFSLIRGLAENVIMPIAGIILTFIACYELIQLVISHNNLAHFETWIFFKWVFKTFVAVVVITNTMNITMAVFDVSQYVITRAGGLINASTAVDAGGLLAFEGRLYDLLLSFVVQFLIYILSCLIFVIVYARMIEIYLMVSLAPIPFATFANKEQSMIGQNYLRSLFALGFQGFLIMVCIGIYAALIHTIVITDDIIGTLWGIAGYTILLAFTLFKTGAVAKIILHAH